MVYITEAEVRQFLPMREAIRLMEEVFDKLASGEALNEPRRRLALPTGAALHYMVASDGKYFGAKVYSTHPQHGAHFVFLLFRAEDGEHLAILEANHLGQIRTGAASGLATKLMAAPEAKTIGVIGSGFQARTQIEAILAVRQIRSVKVWSQSAEKREGFARDCSSAFSISVEAVQTAQECVRDADVIVTATSAKDSVLEAGWVKPGAHINAMGSNQAKRRELPSELIRRADWIAVDSIEQARMESGDLLLAGGEEIWADRKIVELQDVVSGKVPVRRRTQEITIFKSNGLAAEDVIAAGYVFEQALTPGREPAAHYPARR